MNSLDMVEALARKVDDLEEGQMIATSTKELVAWLEELGACPVAIKWVRSLPPDAGLNGAWAQCLCPVLVMAKVTKRRRRKSDLSAVKKTFNSVNRRSG